MSATPLRPAAYYPARPLSRPVSTPASPTPSQVATGLAPSSDPSSPTAGQPSREDQVIHHFYLKTVGVLVDGRLTHFGSVVDKNGESRQDRWFNLTLPDVDLHRSDLHIYRQVSLFPLIRQPGPLPVDLCTIPPLLIAFILDTSDLPGGQALMWNRASGKSKIDMGLLSGKGKGREHQRSGIILERWTFRATVTPADQTTSSVSEARIAFRFGVVHFRALYSLLRLLPAFRMFRRLRRAGNGLRLGIKLWAPEGYPNSKQGLTDAWEVMENGLVGLDTGLDSLVGEEGAPPELKQHFDLPPLDAFGFRYTLNAAYRSEIEFHVEDMESVLSEKFVDMDEDFFTPTVARDRLADEARVSSAELAVRPTSRKQSLPTAIPTNPSPIPQRQQPATLESFARPSGSRLPSGVTPGTMPSGSAGGMFDRWGPLAEGLPFAGAPVRPSGGSKVTVAARRLSGHSVHPFASASPSTSVLRSAPFVGQVTPSPVNRPRLSSSKPSSIGRTSSYLSQSGRSFTHAQLASASPPVTGGMSGVQYSSNASPKTISPISPSSLTFSKQPVPRSLSGRPPYMASSSSSPFIAGSLERDSSLPSPPGTAPQIIQRYSSYSSRQRVNSGLNPTQTGSHSSGDGSPGAGSSNLMRRMSTRQSQESGLRHSLEVPIEAGSDNEDIQAFLKALDSLPQPPSMAAQAAYASRPNLPSTSSSLSNPSVSASSIQPAGQDQALQPSSASNTRAPLTKALIDLQLKQMVGSFTFNTKKFATSFTSLVPQDRSPTPNAPIAPTPRPSAGMGLLSASRPSSAIRRVSAAGGEHDPARPTYRRQASGGSPLSKEATLLPNPADIPLPEASPSFLVSMNKPHAPGSARSLPGPASAPLVEDKAMPPELRSVGVMPIPMPPVEMLSPQTTGGTSTTDSTRTLRRGPVLLRGGFGDQRIMGGKASSSPSHSPIRDFRLRAADNKQVEEEPPAMTRPQTAGLQGGRYRLASASRDIPTVGVTQCYGQGRITAPSSLGGPVEEERRGRSGRINSEGGEKRGNIMSTPDEDHIEDLERFGEMSIENRRE
ncbi:hypothetical protein TREMEDRAFT_71468 [Tremella mesenterica DSM 1558]|uniref:uncharacterized protein n=1 Tax=Tremella mesenterica (strain ATCC 24925 / CBS 8224 / DSM 1558 / NBRC 9311 / NRRL Y-6157 / RJB 2259-6 / UBC 559-6) TaxID=578456 RepID=UPI0003F4958F|nr:uncharacterized protein TREMEDRAFT_71468 [Tremella mesenterica DSM 1558]EIW69958.1 hypothetical protein TREMEDRAFT_71468 [Tremella mesenterica DSM 1558]